MMRNHSLANGGAYLFAREHRIASANTHTDSKRLNLVDKMTKPAVAACFLIRFCKVRKEETAPAVGTSPSLQVALQVALQVRGGPAPALAR
jgi:hypothetical protein